MKIPKYLLPFIPGSVWKGHYELLTYSRQTEGIVSRLRNAPKAIRHIPCAFNEALTLLGLYLCGKIIAEHGVDAYTLALSGLIMACRVSYSIGGRKAREESEGRLEEKLIGKVFE